MKNRKRIFLSVLVVIMCIVTAFCLCSCNNDDEPDMTPEPDEITDPVIPEDPTPGDKTDPGSPDIPVIPDEPVGTEGLIYSYETINDYTYVIVTGYTGTDTNVYIPRVYDELDVKYIAAGAFRNCDYITSITIPDDVGIIGDWTFEGCTGLTSVTGSSGVVANVIQQANPTAVSAIITSGTRIYDRDFAGCTGLTSITIGDSVISIGSSAFYNCTGLTSITIGDSVISIGKDAFEKCTGLTSVHITDISVWCGIKFGNNYSNPLYYAKNLYLNGERPSGDIVISEGATSIPVYTFYNCTALTSVTIPDSVTSIGEYAFYNCTGLTSVHITDISAWYEIEFFYEWSVPNNRGFTSNPLNYAHNLYLNGTLVTDLVIPNDVTEIKDYAFNGATCLTSITIPDSVTSIGSSAFRYCTGLTSVRGSVDNVSTIIEQADSTAVSAIIITSGTSIGYEVFYNCFSLTSVTIPDSVTSIGSYAFYNCTGLASLTIGNSVMSIGSYAFYNCTGLASLTIGNSVTSIGRYAFYNCTGLTSVTIPDSVTSIGSYAFSGCTGLTSVHITDLSAWCGIEFDNGNSNPLSYAKNLYLNGTLVTDLVIPNDVTEIKAYAFEGATCLTSVTIPDSVTSIGSSAFSSCSGLTSVHITDLSAWCGIVFGYTDGGENPGYGCYSNPLIYAKNLYLNGTLVTDIVIPNDVTEIKAYAFKGAKCLTSVTIPDGVTSIGGGAFEYCDKLVEVYNKSNLTITAGSWGNGCVAECAKNVYTDTEGHSKLSTDENGYIIYTDGENKMLVGYAGTATELTLPEGITEIYLYAFYANKNITSVTIPNSVTSIGSPAFYNCTALTEINYNATNCGDLSENNYVFSNAGTEGTGIKVTIGANVKSIPAYLFCPYSDNSSYAPKITEVVFEDGSVCESIGDCAFYGCYKLKKVINRSNLTITAGSRYNGYVAYYAKNVYADVEGQSKLSTDENGYVIYTDGDKKILIDYNGTETELILPEGITEIEGYAFYGNTSITSVTIPDSVTSIGEYAFGDCIGLTSVKWNATACMRAGSYSEHIFYGCDKLTIVNVGAKVTMIPVYAFNDCLSLTNIVFEDASDWYCNNFGNNGTLVDVTNSAYNVTLLNERYCGLRFYKAHK